MKKAELVKKCQERMKSIRDKNYFTLRFGKTKKEIEQAKEMEKENTINFARHCLDKAKDLDILTAFTTTKLIKNKYGQNNRLQDVSFSQ